MQSERESECCSRQAAEAGKDFYAFWLITKQQHDNGNQHAKDSIDNADHNGAVFMNG